MNSPIIAYRANMGVQTTAPFPNTYSLDFDGVDDYVNLGRITAMEGATNFSFAMWVYPTSYTGTRLLFGKHPSATDLFYAYTSDVFGYIQWNIANGQYGYPRVLTSSRIDLNTWGLLTFVYDGSLSGNLNKAKIYINGTQASTSTTGYQMPSSISLDTLDFYVAQLSGILTTPMAGKIDEVSAYDYSLSSSEVMDIYNSGQPTDLSLLPTPPIAWYRMGDNGSYKSPQWLLPNNDNKDKLSNYSFQLDGIDDNVTINSTLGNGFTELSISTWVKYNNNIGITNRYYPLVAKISPVGNCYILQNMRSGASSNGGQLYFNVHTNDGSFSAFSGVVPSPNVWYNVVGTYDGSEIKIYIDGILKGTLSATGTINSNATPLLLGDAGYGGYSAWLNGKLDEVSIYNTALSQGDVTSIYNGGEPTTISGAVAHWRMGEDSTFSTNWTITDQVGSNDGTSANMTIEDRVGEAPSSENNALSYNMDLVDRKTDVPT